MELIPHDEIRPAPSFNFAPMIDFLFLMLSLFATLAISRATLYDVDVQLAELKPDTERGSQVTTSPEKHQIHLSISSSGHYKWLTEFQEYPMKNVQSVQEELSRQYQTGAIPREKEATEVLLHIDRKAPWESIASLLFSVRELGFITHPVYEPMQ